MADIGLAFNSGSSPRMRGTPLHDAYIGGFMGIIPAYAGNTPMWYRWCAWSRDHPRVCGEHMVGYLAGTDSTGSSPRMRGTRLLAYPYARNPGIIPAYAGNTLWSCRFFTSTRDHPRVCGEHAFVMSALKSRPGSSPRMRGTLRRQRGRMGPRGIIPAYAGNTKYCPRRKSDAWDHPRVCGEHQDSGVAG